MLPIRRLHQLSPDDIDMLSAVLIDCVEGGASVSFMHPLPRPKARGFWQRVDLDLRCRARALLVAEHAQGIAGTVQLLLEQPENQAHRADLAKMLVHRRARGRGVGAALLAAAEQLAWSGLPARAPIALASALCDSSAIFATLIAVFVLKEPPDRRVLAAVALASAGTVAIRLG